MYSPLLETVTSMPMRFRRSLATGPMEMTPMEPMMELGRATIFVAPQAAM